MRCVGELDDEYILKMEDVLKIYEKPLSECEPVVCVDEKPVVLHKDTRSSIPMEPGQVARRWVRSSKLAHFAHLNWPTCTSPDVRIRGWTGGIRWNYLK
jgi:hypothetical protein